MGKRRDEPDFDHDRPNHVWVYEAGRGHATHCPHVALLATVFEARPDEWLTPWEIQAWESMSAADAWRWYRMGVVAGPYDKPRPPGNVTRRPKPSKARGDRRDQGRPAVNNRRGNRAS